MKGSRVDRIGFYSHTCCTYSKALTSGPFSFWALTRGKESISSTSGLVWNISRNPCSPPMAMEGYSFIHLSVYFLSRVRTSIEFTMGSRRKSRMQIMNMTVIIDLVHNRIVDELTFRKEIRPSPHQAQRRRRAPKKRGRRRSLE